jgi:DNA ligase-1
MIKRPMKAPTDSITNEQLLKIKFPVVGSFKLDGFRCCVYDGARTSSMKPIMNNFVQRILSQPQYNGLDGELVVGDPFGLDVFNRTSGPLRRYDAIPDFNFYVFDNFLNKEEAYEKRWLGRVQEFSTLDRVIVLPQVLLKNLSEIKTYEAYALSLGYEGIMLRSLNASYKEGRSTFNEGYIYKRKPFDDAEAVIVGFIEEMTNLNEQKEDAMGLMKRSSHQDNKVGKDTLGALILKSPLWNVEFKCGTGQGLTEVYRQHIWDNRDYYKGLTVTFKYQSYGSMDRPRVPILKTIHTV